MIKKKLRIMEYALVESFVNIGRNGYSGLAVITTTAFTLCILWSFLMISITASNYTNQQVDKFEVAAFMKIGATKDETIKVAKEIEQIPGVASVTIKQREKEWELFKIQHSYLDAGGLPSDILPYAMSIKPRNSDVTVSIAEKTRKIQGIDAVFERKELYNKMVAIAKVCHWVGILGVIILFIISTTIIGNAIKLTIYNRRQEIQTMQLVGASHTFIRFPFVFEGMFFGLCGGFVGFIVMIVGSQLISSNIKTFFKMTELLSNPIPTKTIFLGMICCGILIGAVGSILSLNKFLKNYASEIVE